jgi:DNA processing protein
LLKYQIGITLIPGVGDINGKKLISYCGSAEAVFREKRKALLKIPGIGESTVSSIVSNKVLDRAEEEMIFIEKYKIKPLFYMDKAYPNRLKHCIDSPIMLYYKGAADLNKEKIISVVGTRRASDYGKEICSQLIGDLSNLNLLVVSGLAYGIDAKAHQAALQFGMETVGVLAHGLDRIYPYSHRAMAEKMVQSGGLLTDYMSKTNPDRENFPKRNRIIAGLADALIVVESAIKGGALITANIANSYNRDVFAVPGKVIDNFSEGCNYLIKTNKAALIQSARDIEYMMQWEDKGKKLSIQKKLFEELSPEEDSVLKILHEKGDVSVDFIVMQSQFSNSKIAAILLNLEFKGLVKSLPGKIYKAI